MKLFILLSFLVLPFLTSGQNLILNGSLEDTISCPTALNQLERALYWINPTHGSTDYFNACSPGAPLGNMGYQIPHSGQAYAGIGISIGTYREYMEATLLDSLIQGNCYHFEMHASAAHVTYSTDAIQAYFTDSLLDSIPIGQVLNYTPQIINQSGNFPDTTSWLLIQGDYLAHGGEKYIVIGNFFTITPTITIGPPALGGPYLYIDDVSLVLTSCTGIEENPTNNFLINYFDETISVSNSHNFKTSFTLFDINGKQLRSKDFIGNLKLNINELASGIYFYLVSDDQSNKSGKFMK